MWAERARVKEEDASFKTTKLVSYAEIPFLNQVEHSAYVFGVTNANFNQEESFEEEVRRYARESSLMVSEFSRIEKSNDSKREVVKKLKINFIKFGVGGLYSPCFIPSNLTIPLSIKWLFIANLLIRLGSKTFNLFSICITISRLPKVWKCITQNLLKICEIRAICVSLADVLPSCGFAIIIN